MGPGVAARPHPMTRTEGMVRTIVCFGDSNTHGASPHDQSRLPREVRWPGVLRAALGEGWEVIEEGLNGRTTAWDDPFSPGRNGSSYLQPCLWSHAPVDLVIIMLGTNDTKSIFHLEGHEIAAGASRLVDLARQSLAGPGDQPPTVLLVAPVPLGAPTELGEAWGVGRSRETSLQLARHYRTLAGSAGVPFLDAGSVASITEGDGVHLDAVAHRALGLAIAEEVRRLFPSGAAADA